jgi:hypothetical protein
MRILTLLLVFTVASITSGDDKSAFTSLFDGKTLSGWTRFGGKAEAWAVENGQLVSLGEGGGWIGTERDYADFELAAEFRVTSGSNSGIYLRAPADTSHISRTGMEIQILDETHPRHAKIEAWQKTGAVYHIVAPKPGHEKPVGEWNKIEIKLVGPHIQIQLNQAPIIDADLSKFPQLEQEHPGLRRTSGRIGLQSHNGRVEFREIRVRDLAKPVDRSQK